MEIYDFYDDVDQSILRLIAKEVEFPNFVKQANIEIGQLGRSQKSLFAWPEENKFPLDEPSDLFLSVCYFSKTAHKIPTNQRAKVAETLKEYIEMTGFDMSDYIKEPEPVQQEYLPQEDFAVSIPWDQISPELQSKYAKYNYGGNLAMYPLHDENMLKEAIAHFPRSLDGPMRMFRPLVAIQITKRAGFDNIPYHLKQYLPMAKEAYQDQILVRAGMAPDYAEQYQALAELADAEDFNNFRLKVAQVIHDMDVEFGLNNFWDSRIVHPDKFAAGLIGEPDPVVLKEKGASKNHVLNVYKNNEDLLQVFPGLANVKTASEFKGFMNSLSEEDLLAFKHLTQT